MIKEQCRVVGSIWDSEELQNPANYYLLLKVLKEKGDETQKQTCDLGSFLLSECADRKAKMISSFSCQASTEGMK